jgi:NAD(P)H-quinone oxidoreductase subunit I
MSLKQYFKNIWEAVYTIALGMKITARYGVDPREEITEQYPEEKWEPYDRFRGFLHNDVPRCISCSMCARICPVDCIELDSFMGPDKKRVLTRFDINIGRCMFCGLCTEVCPTKCLTHTEGYEGMSSFEADKKEEKVGAGAGAAPVNPKNDLAENGGEGE